MITEILAQISKIVEKYPEVEGYLSNKARFVAAVAKSAPAGHPFYGNQWTGGRGGAIAPSSADGYTEADGGVYHSAVSELDIEHFDYGSYENYADRIGDNPFSAEGKIVDAEFYKSDYANYGFNPVRYKNLTTIGEVTNYKATDEEKGLFDYKGGGYAAINALLRDDEEKILEVGEYRIEMAEISQHKIDNAMRISGLSHNTVLYRGVGTSLDETLDSLKPGESFVDYGFSSTTLMDSRKLGYKKNRTQLVIYAAKGTRGIFLDGVWQRFEHEVLLDRSTKYTLLKRVRNSSTGDTLHVVAEN